VIGSAIQEYMKAVKIASDQTSGTIVQPSGDSWPLPERLRTFVNRFEYTAPDDYNTWKYYAKLRAVESAIPLASASGARPEPRYFMLPIVSGDFVVADPAFKDWLLSIDRKRSVVEMESAGAARAVKEYDQDVSLIVLRGISDFADPEKAALDRAAFGGDPGTWRRYASQNAIELLLAFLSSPDFSWRRSVATRPPADPATPSSAAGSGEVASQPGAGRAWNYFMTAVPVAQLGLTAAQTVRNWPHGPHPDPLHPGGASDDGQHGVAHSAHHDGPDPTHYEDYTSYDPP
jgi:hypothetical protein